MKKPINPLVPLALIVLKWRRTAMLAATVAIIAVLVLLSGCGFWKGASEKATTAAASTVPGGSLITAAVKAASKPETNYGKIERLVMGCVEDRDDDFDFREAYPTDEDRCRRCWHIMSDARQVMDYEEDRERICSPKLLGR